jgi:hypothetical protein
MRNPMTIPQTQWLTLIFLLAVSAAVIGYDILIIQLAGPDASVSRVLSRLLELPSAFVVFVFWLGVLVGHVWMPTR